MFYDSDGQAFYYNPSLYGINEAAGKEYVISLQENAPFTLSPFFAHVFAMAILLAVNVRCVFNFFLMFLL